MKAFVYALSPKIIIHFIFMKCGQGGINYYAEMKPILGA